MTPRDFLEVVVRPNVVDFKGDSASLRLAFNAVASVDALAAHLYHWCVVRNPSALRGASGDSHFRGALAALSDDFRLIRDVAKADTAVPLRWL